MPVIAMAMQIPPEKYETWGQAVSDFNGPRSEEFDAVRRRQGVSWQRVFVQPTSQGHSTGRRRTAYDLTGVAPRDGRGARR
jgi:hypothetical protein